MHTNERMNLILPIILLVILVAGISVDGPFQTMFGDSSTLAQRLLVDIVFLNVTHNAFTLMMIASFPELKSWTAEQGAGDPKKFWLKIGLIYLGLATFFLFALMSKAVWLQAIFIFLSVFFPIQHALAQSLGLSLVYNGKPNAKSEGTQNPEKWERFLVMVLLFVVTGTVLGLRWLPESVEVRRSSFGLAQSSMLFLIPVAIGALLVGLMFLYPRPIRLKKIAFSMRYPIWAFSLASPLGLMATQIVHGFEYFSVVRRMSSNSKFSRWHGLTILLLCAVILIGILRVTFYDGIAHGRTDVPSWLAAAAAISTAFSFLHYYLDRELFLMRKPINRETVGQLLK